jgi:hypothetical protein
MLKCHYAECRGAVSFSQRPSKVASSIKRL